MRKTWETEEARLLRYFGRVFICSLGFLVACFYQLIPPQTPVYLCEGRHIATLYIKTLKTLIIDPS